MPRPWKKQFNISPPPNTMELRDHTFNAPIFVLFDDSCKYKVHTSAGTFNDTLMMIDAVPFPSNWNELYLYFVRVVRTDVDQFRARNFQKHICSFTLLGNVTKIHTFDYLTTWLLDYLPNNLPSLQSGEQASMRPWTSSVLYYVLFLASSGSIRKKEQSLSKSLSTFWTANKYGLSFSMLF